MLDCRKDEDYEVVPDCISDLRCFMLNSRHTYLKDEDYEVVSDWNSDLRCFILDCRYTYLKDETTRWRLTEIVTYDVYVGLQAVHLPVV